MKKNILVACVGPTSLHHCWLDGDRDFDLMIVDYKGIENYKDDGEYYIQAKGTKFNIIADIFDQIPKEYERIFIPDDDLYMKPADINKLFSVANQYNLNVCQPSLVGYYSVAINLHHPASILRYTNFVEIIGPCFDRTTFDLCRDTFNYNKSCWGIELLWDMKLGFPKDKIAIIDEVIAVHTRPCFRGDNYSNNNVESPYYEYKKLVEENNLSWDKVVYETLAKEIDYDEPPENRLYPPLDEFHNFCKRIGRKNFI